MKRGVLGESIHCGACEGHERLDGEVRDGFKGDVFESFEGDVWCDASQGFVQHGFGSLS